MNFDKVKEKAKGAAFDFIKKKGKEYAMKKLEEKTICKTPAASIISNAKKAGWLTKQGGSIKNWKRRYFILYHTKIYYYANEGDSTAKGFIDLTEANNAFRVSEQTTSFQHSFQVQTAGRLYSIYAENEDEADEWVKVINEVINGAAKEERKKKKKSGGDLGVASKIAGMGGAMLKGSDEEEEDSDEDSDESEEEDLVGSAMNMAQGGMKNPLSGSSVSSASEAARRAEKQKKKNEKKREKKKSAQERRKYREEEKRRRKEEWLKQKAREEEERCQKYLDFMKEGAMFLKYPYHKGKPHKRYFALSADEKEIKWGSKKGKYDRTLPLSDIQWLVFGAFSGTFKNNFPNVEGKYRCFSIKTNDRSVDIQAETDEECDKFFLGLQYLLKETISRNQRPLLTGGQLRWKRLKENAEQRSMTIGTAVKNAVEDLASTDLKNIYQLRLFFNAFDRNGNGLIDKNEFITFFAELGEHIVQDEYFEDAWDEVDLDGNGQLNFKEFLNVAMDLFDVNEIAQIAKIRNIFDKYDKDRSGTIDRNEVRGIFQEYEGANVSETVVSNFMEAVDVDHSGTISWREFLTAAMRNFPAFESFHNKPRHEKELYLFFQAFDQDGSGYLSKSEVISFFHQLGEWDLEEDESFNRFFRDIDSDGSGELSFSEFRRLASALFDVKYLSMVARIRNIFDKYDKDHSGAVDMNEVRDIIREFEGTDVPDSVVENFVNALDSDGSGNINWREFLTAALTSFDEFNEYHKSKGM